MADSTEELKGCQLGHYVRSQAKLGGVTSWYDTQALPARPRNGSAVHRIECESCRQPLDIKVTSQARANARRAIKLVVGLVLLVGAIIVFLALDQARPDPVTFQYPAWMDWVPLPLIFAGFGGVALIGLSFYEYGVKITIPPGSRARRGSRAHRILGRRF